MAIRPNYRVLVLDLAVARTAGEVLADVGVGTPYFSVSVLDGSATPTAFLRLGPNADPIPAYPGLLLETSCPGQPLSDQGLFVANAAGAGTLTLFVGLADGSRAGIG